MGAFQPDILTHSLTMAGLQYLCLMLMLCSNNSYQRDVLQPFPQGLSEVLKSLQSFPDKMSPFLIPGTEVSEKLNGVHGFMFEKNVKGKNIPARRKKLKNKTLASG